MVYRPCIVAYHLQSTCFTIMHVNLSRPEVRISNRLVQLCISVSLLRVAFSFIILFVTFNLIHTREALAKSSYLAYIFNPPPLGMTQLKVHKYRWNQKTIECLVYMRVSLRNDIIICVFGRTPACDGRTTDGQRTS